MLINIYPMSNNIRLITNSFVVKDEQFKDEQFKDEQ